MSDDKTHDADDVTLVIGDEEIPVGDIDFDAAFAAVDEASPDAAIDATLHGTEFSGSFEFEAPPRDLEHIVGPQEVNIDADLPGLESGTYRRCPHCEETLIHTDNFESHLEDEHNLER